MEVLKMIVLKLLNLMAALCVVIILSGCVSRVAPINKTTVALPSTFSRSGTAELSGNWWLAFEDQALNDLIEQALSDNFSLKSSWARLNQANALYAKNRATLFPSLEGDASAGHSINRSDGSSINTDTLLVGLSASYEIDLWGRIDSTIEAARLDREATAADLDTAAISLTAEVALTWYRLMQQHLSLALYDHQIETNTKALELISAQFRTGQVPLVDVLQQRQLIESQQGEKVLLLSEKGQTEHSLAILLGQVPGALQLPMPTQIIELPELPVTGIPTELIQSRPDVRSSFLAVQAADQRVAAAISDQYPSLRLNASVETVSTSSSSIFSDYLASIIAGLTAPLFDGGLRKAEVARTQGAAEEQLNVYATRVLTAVSEVEDALLREEKQQQYIESLQDQLDLATQTIEQVKDRYLYGVENYQRVLTALVSLQSLQQKMITAQTDLLINRVELCRALGTSWRYSNTKAQS